MQNVTLQDIYNFSSIARNSIWETAKENNREPKIYLHWSAGRYGQYSREYHINIDNDGKLYVPTVDFSTTLSHTWKRNSGSIGIALCCAYGGGSNNLGNYPPTSNQIEAMPQAIVAVAEGLWLTIDKNHVLTHGEAANNEDGYTEAHNPYAWWNDSYGDGDTRGDLEYLGTAESPRYNPHATDGSRGGDVLRGKANWYQKQQKEKQILFKYQ